jgi:hypothetical protein
MLGWRGVQRDAAQQSIIERQVVFNGRPLTFMGQITDAGAASDGQLDQFVPAQWRLSGVSEHHMSTVFIADIWQVPLAQLQHIRCARLLRFPDQIG